MRAERHRKAGWGAERRGKEGNGRRDNEEVHWPKTKAEHQKRGQSVSSWSKPQILVQRERQKEEGKEAELPLCDQYEHGSFVNRTIVLIKLEHHHIFLCSFYKLGHIRPLENLYKALGTV